MSIDVEIVLWTEEKRDFSFICISIIFFRCWTGKASEQYVENNRNSWKWVEQCFLAQDPQGLQSCVELDLPLQATWHL